MNRKNFLKLAPAGGLALMLNGYPVRSVAGGYAQRLLARATSSGTTNNVMVFIQLNGGNDGLNTVIPIDQYSNLSAARANILIPENKILPIDGVPNTGLHPAMTGIQQMYNEGLVNIVQGVSYPDPSFSHFRAIDIWLTGSDADQSLENGWMGRYLATQYPGFPAGYPSSTQPDPPAIEIGTSLSTGLMGPNVSMGAAISDIDSFYNLVSNTVSPAPATQAGNELTFLRFMAQETQLYTSSIQAAAGKAKNLSSKYVSGNSLCDQLKIVARLIAGGLQTSVYLVNLASFDSHVDQVDGTDTTTGGHAYLLGMLSDAVSAFFDDCKLLKIDNRVCAMTFSEFGRRICSNGGLGTDHGTSEPIMVFGAGVKPGIIGSNPVIPQNATPYDNLDMQFDYRSVYASVIEDWLGNSTGNADSVLLKNYPILPIFRKDQEPTLKNNDILLQNYPNPFSISTTIRFLSHGGWVTILLMNEKGQTIKTILSQEMDAGMVDIVFSRDNLPSGTYLFQLINGPYNSVKKMAITG